MFALAREHAPQVDLHISTQASVSNVEAARMWHRLGAKRIVTAREMSLEEIAQLKAELPDVEVEVFVQGAMCTASLRALSYQPTILRGAARTKETACSPAVGATTWKSRLDQVSSFPLKRTNAAPIS